VILPTWSLNMADFQQELDSLLSDFCASFKGPMPLPDEMAQGFFLLNIQMSRNAWHTVSYLCANERNSQDDWMWDYVLLIPPINRVLLDSLFNVVFVLEDLENRLRWFHESGWREAREQLDREKAAYQGLEEWTEYLDRVELSVAGAATKFQISGEKQKNLRLIKYWPNPGKMPKHESTPSTDARPFLQYLNDWFYREMSSQSHLSFHGMMKLAMLALRRDYSPEIRRDIEGKYLESFRAEQVSRTLTCTLTLLSELNISFQLSYGSRLLALWNRGRHVVPDMREIYKHRYEALGAI
jgi:hypothetical protein